MPVIAPSAAYPRAVLFDLLTALLDSWTVWNAAAGAEARGRAWRAEYLRLTYGCGAYQPYEQLVETAAAAVGASSSLITVTIGLFTGISVGTSVVASQAMGPATGNGRKRPCTPPSPSVWWEAWSSWG